MPTWERPGWEGDASPVHALVIGVGDYPWLEGGATQGSSTMGLGQLPSAPVSAAAFARWFVGATRPGGGPATLELLLSGDPGVLPEGWGESPAADLASIEVAYSAFRARCDRPGAIGLVYFCGHGVWDGINTLLLARDFGQSDLNPWRHAFDVTKTHLAATSWRSAGQAWFVDACRKRTDELVGAVAASAAPLETAVPPFRCDSLLAHGAEHGRAAHGEGTQVSWFTGALLRALDGLAALREAGGRWVVRTGTLLPAVNAVLARDRRPQRAVLQPSGSGQLLLNQLANPPEVPVEIAVDPQPDLARAVLYLRRGTGPRIERRPPVLASWRHEVPAGVYEVGAEVADAPLAVLEEEWLAPPLYECILRRVP